jgi:hypothetical protein
MATSKLDKMAGDISAINVQMAVQSVRLDNLVTQFTALNDNLKCQNGRIGKLEKWRTWIVGAAGGFAILAGAFARTVWDHVTK